MTKVVFGVARCAAGANDTQADAGFVTKAVNTGRDEVAASTLAVAQSTSGAIKRVAKTIRADQRTLSDQLLEIARVKGMAVPAQEAAARPSPYSDAAFIEREINSYLQAIALYEDEESSSDAQLRAFAQRIVPQLRCHLALLQSLKTGN